MFPNFRKISPRTNYKSETANPVFQLQRNGGPVRFLRTKWRPWRNPAAKTSLKGLWVYLLAGFFMIVALYGFWAEPYWIQINRFHLQMGIYPPLKIAHLTDLHTYGLGSREQEVLNRLEEEKPDLIAITGDTLAQSGTYELCRPFLSRLHAPSGVWAVPGNFENRRRLDNESAFYNSLNIHYLINSSQFIRPNLCVVGLDDAASGFPNLDAALAFVPKQAATLVLMHSPGYFRQAAGRCDLILAGHSHGGQIRLPFVGGLWFPKGVDGFTEGWFEKEKTRMYVSRGLGTVLLDVRLFCRPELVLITLE
jgi:predicted MPP superfamily phosphohydrolase